MLRRRLVRRLGRGCSARACRCESSRRWPSGRIRSLRRRATGARRCAAAGGVGTPRRRLSWRGVAGIGRARLCRIAWCRAEPEVGRVGERMAFAFGEVGEQCLGGGGSDRDDPPAAALAAPDGDEPRDEIDVVELRSTSSPERMAVSSISRMIASSRRWCSRSPVDGSLSGAAQVAMRARSSVSVRGSTSGGSTWGAFIPGNGWVASSPPSVSQVAKRRTACCRIRAVPGAEPASSIPATHWFRHARRISRWPPAAHQRR